MLSWIYISWQSVKEDVSSLDFGKKTQKKPKPKQTRLSG